MVSHFRVIFSLQIWNSLSVFVCLSVAVVSSMACSQRGLLPQMLLERWQLLTRFRPEMALPTVYRAPWLCTPLIRAPCIPALGLATQRTPPCLAGRVTKYGSPLCLGTSSVTLPMSQHEKCSSSTVCEIGLFSCVATSTDWRGMGAGGENTHTLWKPMKSAPCHPVLALCPPPSPCVSLTRPLHAVVRVTLS